MAEEPQHTGQQLTYYVDDEPQQTSKEELTVERILEKAGARMDPEQQAFLYELRDNERIEHKDPNERIRLKPNARFATEREAAKADVEVGRAGTEYRSAETPTTASPVAPGVGGSTERTGRVTEQTAKRELRGEEAKEEEKAEREERESE